MSAPGLVILSQNNVDAPTLPAIATVSKGESWDDGGRALGLAAARDGRLWLDRPYFKGLPDTRWLTDQCRTITEAGGFCQVGNELNHPIEEWTWGPGGYGSLWETLTGGYPIGNWVAMPPSPGLDGWQDWVIRDAKRHAVHTYGTYAEMRAIVEWFLENTTGDCFISECNYGPAPGKRVDLNQWARDHFAPFLAWCATKPRIKLVAYFAWRWQADTPIETPVDAIGTAIVDVLRAAADGTPIIAGGSTVTTNEVDRYLADIWKRAGVPYNPDSAFAKYWRAEIEVGRYLGRPEEPEHRTENGAYAIQAFAGAILSCKVGEWVVKRGLPLT